MNRSNSAIANPRLLVALGALGALVLAPEPADARTRSRAWFGTDLAFTRPGTANHQPGAAGELGLELSFDDFWSAVASAGVAYHLGREETEELSALDALILTDVTLGARLALDVLAYVPHLGLSFVFYPSGPPVSDEGDRAVFGVEVEVGLTWYIDRDWSIGGRVAVAAPAATPDVFSLYAVAGLNVAYHWRW